MSAVNTDGSRHTASHIQLEVAHVFRQNTLVQLVLPCRLTAALLVLFSVSAHAQMPKEKPSGYVSDFAGVLSAAARQQLESLATELDRKTHAQLAVVTVKSLEGRPLEEFTLDLATRWGIGHKAKKPGDEAADRGVLLFLAIQDRRSRIEVGYGLESIIPDGKAGGILRSMVPQLRGGDYDGAVQLGATSITQIIAKAARVTVGSHPTQATVTPANAPTGLENSGLEFLGILALGIVYFAVAKMSRKKQTGNLSADPPSILTSTDLTSTEANVHRGGKTSGTGWTRWLGDGGDFFGGGFGGGGFGGGGASGHW